MNQAKSSFFKKSLLKRTIALLMVGAMGGALTACGGDGAVSSGTSSTLPASSSSSSLLESSSLASSQEPKSSAPSSVASSSQASSSKASSSDEVVATGAGTGIGYKGSDWRLRVPNIENPLVESEIPDVTQINQPTDGRKHYFDTRAIDNLNAMMDDAAAAGLNLFIISSFRTLDYQTNLFERRVKEQMAQGYSRAVAENIVAEGTARPGTSDHQLGLAIDFNTIEDGFEKTAEYKWLIQHCAEYGFILRFPADKEDITKVMYEPWHYRYVGVEHAKEIMSRGICLEEYVSEL
ncbi:MAG: M15 family metallopeptidase [Clostridiales bacterium]|nr:M15 family metallopeptidase [Clostridiales bacterium]